MAIRSRIPPTQLPSRKAIFSPPSPFERANGQITGVERTDPYIAFRELFVILYNKCADEVSEVNEALKDLLIDTEMEVEEELKGFLEDLTVSVSSANLPANDSFEVDEVNQTTPYPPSPIVSSYSPSVLSVSSVRSSMTSHKRKLSERLQRFVERVSGKASPRPSRRVQPGKSPAEQFRDSLACAAEANSLKEFLTERNRILTNETDYIQDS